MFFAKNLPFPLAGGDGLQWRSRFLLPPTVARGYCWRDGFENRRSMGTIFCSGVVMPAAFASDCGGLSARQSVSPSSMLFPGFGFGCHWCAGVFLSGRSMWLRP